MARLAEYYQTLLAAALADMNQPIAELPFLIHPERQSGEI